MKIDSMRGGNHRSRVSLLALLVAASVSVWGGVSEAQTTAPRWKTIVNNASKAPQSTPAANAAYFFSYNQPAINDAGDVVFRARAKPIQSTGEADSAQPTHGVYRRSALVNTAPVSIIADNLGMLVPPPNTTGATFVEFPSTPRIDSTTGMIATRAQSKPVYALPDGTKVGTSGVFAAMSTFTAGLTTGVDQLGAVPAYSYFQVPDAPAGTRFDQFPGSPSPLAGEFVVFKGNYTEGGTSKTGVYYRSLLGTGRPVVGIAHTGTPIPNRVGAVFGSTAPPSTAKHATTGLPTAVFAGFDNEEKPTAGGLYAATLGVPNVLTPIVAIGGAVPGVAGAKFTGFGESLSFDGRYVAFWGSWGTQTKVVHKDCPDDGNADLLAFCRQQYPNGADLVTPVSQGMFLADLVANRVSLVARTGVVGFTDFLYWVYSGKPPGEGDSDAEPPRWRASSFVAVTRDAVVLKGQKGTVDGLYVRATSMTPLRRVLDTTMSGRIVDPKAPGGSLISAIGVERDGFRKNRLSITASMLNAQTTESWAGVYVHDCQTGCLAW